jgi:hypothetical protein
MRLNMPGHMTMGYDSLLGGTRVDPPVKQQFMLSINLHNTTVNIETSDPSALEKVIDAIHSSHVPLLKRLFVVPKTTIVFSGNPQVVIVIRHIVSASIKPSPSK